MKDEFIYRRCIVEKRNMFRRVCLMRIKKICYMIKDVVDWIDFDIFSN